MKKRWLGIALVLCMVLSLLPFGASAAEIVDRADFDDGFSYTLDSDGVLTIYGTGEMKNLFPSTTGPWRSVQDKIQKVVIEEGITNIGDFSFNSCSNLKEATIPKSVTRIGEYAFGSSLRNIYYGGTESQWNQINAVLDFFMWRPCWRNNAIVHVSSGETLPRIGTCGENLTWELDDNGVFTVAGIGEMSSYEKDRSQWWEIHDDIRQVVLNDGVKNIGSRAFEQCKNLISIQIPKSVDFVGLEAFGGCEKFKDVFYDGTSSEWKAVKIDFLNEVFNNAEFHFMDDESRPLQFIDVATDQYYYEPVLWAVNHDPQITAGTSATTFSPSNPCTRGQIVTFLWRANGQPEPTITKNPFTDVKSSDYFYKAVLWAVEKEITAGTSKTTFSPNDTVTRAQTVTFLWRAEGKPAVQTKNPFTDVPAGEYYTDAVLWAVKHEVTAGTSATTFSPANPCTRAQIVTFLFRDLTKK